MLRHTGSRTPALHGETQAAGTVPSTSAIPELCPLLGTSAGSLLLVRRQRSPSLQREKGQSVGLPVSRLESSSLPPWTPSSLFSPIFVISAPLSDFIYLTISMSARLGRKKTVHEQIYQTKPQICEFLNKTGPKSLPSPWWALMSALSCPSDCPFTWT